MMKNNSLIEIAKVLKKSKNVAIFAHSEPDFDAISSALALKYALEQRKINADYICKDAHIQSAKDFFGDKISLEKFDKNKYDTYISVDNPSKLRCEHAEIFSSQTNSIVLDHHKNLDFLGKYNYVDIEKSSCSEIVFLLLEKGKFKINKNVASMLYAGLSADSGSFINTNTNADSFLNAYKLVTLGADIARFNEIFYRSVSEKEIRIRKFIYENYHLDNGIAYCTISNEKIKKLKADKKDFSTVSSELIKLKKAKIAFSVIEKEPCKFYTSFRSKKDYSVREIAEKFGGGGHKCACAFKIEDKNTSVEKIKNNVLKEIKNKIIL